jgi:hypothetical protein
MTDTSKSSGHSEVEKVEIDPKHARRKASSQLLDDYPSPVPFASYPVKRT